jgi:predicted RNase H-like HicB family nuclease
MWMAISFYMGVFIMSVIMSDVYPVVFSREDDGTFCVYAPDFPGCVTEAADYADGVAKIREGICGMLYVMERNGLEQPTPSSPEAVKLLDGEVVALVDAPFDEYKQRIDSHAAVRSVSWG